MPEVFTLEDLRECQTRFIFSGRPTYLIQPKAWLARARKGPPNRDGTRQELARRLVEVRTMCELKFTGDGGGKTGEQWRC